MRFIARNSFMLLGSLRNPLICHVQAGEPGKPMVSNTVPVPGAPTV